MEMQDTQNSQNDLEKNKVGKLILPNSKITTKLHNQDGVIQAQEQTYKSMELNPEIVPHIKGQLIFDKGAKTIQCLFNKWC